MNTITYFLLDPLGNYQGTHEAGKHDPAPRQLFTRNPPPEAPAGKFLLWTGKEWIIRDEPVQPGPAPRNIPQEASRRQILTALGIKGWITMEEAEQALATGAKPAAVLAVIDSLPEEERFPARMKWAGFQHAYRTDPMVLALAQVEGKTDAEIDELFIFAASID